MKFKQGFTLIELLLVVAIMAIIFIFSAPLSIRFYNNQLLDEAQSNIISTLYQARHNASLQKNDSDWGVKFDNTAHNYVLFQGSTYDTRVDTYDEVYDLLDLITITGPTEIVFYKLAGLPSATGTIAMGFNDILKGILVGEAGDVSKIGATSTETIVDVPVIPTEGLISYWPFDGDATDNWGTHHGTVSNATLTTGLQGVTNTAYSFNGSTSIINVGNMDPDIVGLPEISYSVWVKATSFDGLNRTIFSNTLDNYAATEIFYGASNQVFFGNFTDGTPHGWGPGLYNTPLNVDTWYHLVFVYNGSNLSLYIDGVKAGESSLVQGLTARGGTSAKDFVIGGRSIDTYMKRWNGIIDEARIYSRALTQEDITNLYNADKPPVTVPEALTIGIASAGNTQATVRYTAGYSGGSTITSYTVTSNPGNISTTTTSATSAIITGLTNGIAYTFTVTATNSVGTSIPSSASNQVTPSESQAVFDPNSIAGLSVWIDASARTDNDGTAITSLSDLSGNGRNFTGNATIKTNILNGFRVARVTNSQTLRNTTNFGRPITVFYVAKQNDTASGRLLSGVANNWLLGHWSTFKYTFHAEGWVSASSGTAKDANWHIWVGRQTNTTSSMWDGLTPVSLVSPTAGTQGPNGLVFTGHQGSTERTNADLAELIVYDSALLDENITTVTNYLKTKYNL